VNVGDRLNAAAITGGAFMGGFDKPCVDPQQPVRRERGHALHPRPADFPYWESTQKAAHLPPTRAR